MAKFRDSTPEATVVEVTAPRHPRVPPAMASAEAEEPVLDRSIGDIIAELRDLSAEQVERVLAHQRETGVRFGEAAVALGLASKEDVLFAQLHFVSISYYSYVVVC